MHRTLVVSILASIAATAHAQPRVPAAAPDAIGIVTFASGSSRVERAVERIEDIAEWHTRHADSMLIVEGHASPEGSARANLRLSQERADAVRNALVRAGADGNRIVVVAHGENAPAGAVRSDPRVVIRASGDFTELVREQRDPETAEDARADGRTTDEPRDVAADERDTRPTGGTTVVIVPTAPAADDRRTTENARARGTGDRTTTAPPDGSPPSGAGAATTPGAAGAR